MGHRESDTTEAAKSFTRARTEDSPRIGVGWKAECVLLEGTSPRHGLQMCGSQAGQETEVLCKLD